MEQRGAVKEGGEEKEGGTNWNKQKTDGENANQDIIGTEKTKA